MNFDRNGVLVHKSTPTPQLRTVKKTLVIDSADRDTGINYTNGEFVVYLPRVYEKVVAIRLAGAEFPTIDLAVQHSYLNGQNLPNATYSADTIAATPYPTYFVIELDGLNKTDETAYQGNKSQFPDAFFAKIPVVASANKSTTTASYFVQYNDHNEQENIAHYTPAIGKLDRLRIRTRLHSQQGSQGFLYWTNTGLAATTSTLATSINWSMTLEIEYLDNGFDQFSSLETRLRPDQQMHQ
uniref:Uncharacterized protein n=1 Tax=viral metagenome TaxID=1070528 RepID=A0A6C0J7N2_9ZZZZ